MWFCKIMFCNIYASVWVIDIYRFHLVFERNYFFFTSRKINVISAKVHLSFLSSPSRVSEKYWLVVWIRNCGEVLSRKWQEELTRQMLDKCLGEELFRLQKQYHKPWRPRVSECCDERRMWAEMLGGGARKEKMDLECLPWKISYCKWVDSHWTCQAAVITHSE